MFGKLGSSGNGAVSKPTNRIFPTSAETEQPGVGANLPACTCDECGRKTELLRRLEAGEEPPVDSQSGQLQGRVEVVREELLSHARMAALAPQDNKPGDRFAMRKPNPKRSWLAYDPDALLPNHFDAFLYGGGCPKIYWPGVASMRERSKLTLEVSLYYIVGCRRSGMTILAELISRYTSVVFVNEPRQLWIPLLPAMDVWSVAAPSRQGRLYFSPEEASVTVEEGLGPPKTVAQLLIDAYTNMAELSTSPALVQGQTSREALVVEKFQEHAFRLPMLADVCRQELGPNRCTFLHIIRDGVDVARSIAAAEDPAAWYGVRGEWKWKCLRELVAPASQGGLSDSPLTCCQLELSDKFLAILDLARGDERCRFARGLVEWAASILAARDGAEKSADVMYIEVRFEELVTNRACALVGMLKHLDLEPSAAARQCARSALIEKPSRPLNSVEKEVLSSARGSKVEKLLREFGRELPQ